MNPKDILNGEKQRAHRMARSSTIVTMLGRNEAVVHIEEDRWEQHHVALCRLRQPVPDTMVAEGIDDVVSKGPVSVKP